LQVKPSKIKNKLFVLGHIITRNLNKKGDILPWKVSPNAVYFFFPEYT
jgi:hypothetical protein